MGTRRMRAAACFGLVVLETISALMPAYVRCQAREDAKADTVLLSDGTPVHLVLMDDLEGGKLQVKQTVHFKVRENLVVGTKLVVKTGAQAVGHIESASKSGLLGKSGRLILQFDYVETVSGAKLLLRGGAGVSGGKGGALTWESALWYGPNASLPVGTIINAFVNQDQQVPVP